MFWGPGAPEITAGFVMIQGTLVIEGRKARAWHQWRRALLCENRPVHRGAPPTQGNRRRLRPSSVSIHGGVELDQMWWVRRLRPAPGYVGAVAAEGPDWQLRLRQSDPEALAERHA